MDRRAFLASSGALAPAPRIAFSQKTTRLHLAAARQSRVGGPHPPTEVWAYNGAVPGPVLRYRQGERLRIAVENALDADTTVHWHGIRVPNAKGGRFTYEFELPDAVVRVA